MFKREHCVLCPACWVRLLRSTGLHHGQQSRASCWACPGQGRGCIFLLAAVRPCPLPVVTQVKLGSTLSLCFAGCVAEEHSASLNVPPAPCRTGHEPCRPGEGTARTHIVQLGLGPVSGALPSPSVLRIAGPAPGHLSLEWPSASSRKPSKHFSQGSLPPFCSQCL